MVASPKRLRRERFGSWLFRSGSLTRRMLAVAALWIVTLLLIGGFVLERTVTRIIIDGFDGQLSNTLNSLIASVEIGSEGEIRLSRPLGDQRFYEPYSGHYWQISVAGVEPLRSRSLWDRALVESQAQASREAIAYDSAIFAGEPLRVVQRDIVLPSSPLVLHVLSAQSRTELNRQLTSVRAILLASLGVLGLGLIVLATLQAGYGLWPLRRISEQIAAIRTGAATRVSTDFPTEVSPMVGELNELLEHNEKQAEAARMHAGNLAHALKTPMAVLINEARTEPGSLAATVRAQTAIMRRHVDHHLARARAIGRRSAVNARAVIWPSLLSLQRAIARIYPSVKVDIDGNQAACFRGERQDLEEMLGNLIDNAAKYGGGCVFVGVSDDGEEAGTLTILCEDDGPGIEAEERGRIFGRGARLDTEKPGTGLGLAIVKDVAEIYGGSVELGTSTKLGGLAARLVLPRAEA
jgi:signal transduction histidine kinase